MMLLNVMHCMCDTKVCMCLYVRNLCFSRIWRYRGLDSCKERILAQKHFICCLNTVYPVTQELYRVRNEQVIQCESPFVLFLPQELTCF